MKFLFAICILLAGCNNKRDTIGITGDVKGIPDGKIYLSEAHQFWTFLDSTDVEDGKFKFTIKADSNFYPYLASLIYPDPASPTGLLSISFSNISSNGFYLEKGKTKITGTNEKNSLGAPLANVSIGKETKLLIAYKMQFGGIAPKGDPKREGQLNFIKQEIRKYPYSYFLLDGIYEWRRRYTNAELKSLLELFDKDVQQSKLASKVKWVTVTRPDDDAKLVNSEIIDDKGMQVPLIDPGKRINIIIFWASWCKPCREEIPQLKEFYQSIKSDPGIHMRSISIDEDPDMWEEAMEAEKMQWSQARVRNSEIETIMTRYNFAAIPLIIVCDNNLNLINRFSGFDSTILSSLLNTVEYTYKYKPAIVNN